MAPVYSNFQWRTPLLALEKIFAGEEIPKEWVLPQKPIPEDELDELAEAQRRHAGRPLRQVRRRGPAGLPGGLAGAADPLTRTGGPAGPVRRGTAGDGQSAAGIGGSDTTRWEEGSMERPIGINTWVWESPLTDATLPGLLAKVAGLGFDAVELPLENAGDFSAGTVPGRPRGHRPDALRGGGHGTGPRPGG